MTSWMTTAFVLAATIVLTSSSASAAASPQAGKTRSACSLLTIDDVKVVAASESPRLNSAASGENIDGTDDFCVWVGKSSPDPLVQFVVKVPPGPNAPLVFTVTSGDYFGGGPEPAAVPGLGDEALYRNFITGKGGTVVVRKGNTVFSITSLLPKETIIALAKKVTSRM